MGKKGKGRQSGGFGSKSLKANHHHEVSRLKQETLEWTRKETAGFVAWSNARQIHQRRLAGERPRFASALRKNLNGILHERQALRSYQFRERRRRNGFLPRENGTTAATGGLFNEGHEQNVSKGLVHPPGWLLRHKQHNNNRAESEVDRKENEIDKNERFGGHPPKRKVPSLQTLALSVFAHYIREYRNAMGDEELYGALSILSAESITDLSILLSSGSTVSYAENENENNDNNTGKTAARGGNGGRRRNRNRDAVDSPPVLYMDDNLAMLLGQHQHVERLCFRSRISAGTGRATLTSSGLEALIPRIPVLFRGRHRRWRKNDTHDGDPNSTEDGGDNNESSSSTTKGVPENWEDDSESSSDNTDEIFGFENEEEEAEGDDGSRHDDDVSRIVRSSSGCNLRLRRLELLDLSCTDNTIDVDFHVDDNGNAGTTRILLRWFETCSGITHLSLAGSFRVHHEVGRTILLSLPRVLPSLEVLDVTRCPWATDSLLARTMSGYVAAAHHIQSSANQDHGTDNNNNDGNDHALGNTPMGSKNCSIATPSSSPQDLLVLPTFYYYRGRFEWLPETMHNTVETDLWEDDVTS